MGGGGANGCFNAAPLACVGGGGVCGREGGESREEFNCRTNLTIAAVSDSDILQNTLFI